MSRIVHPWAFQLFGCLTAAATQEILTGIRKLFPDKRREGTQLVALRWIIHPTLGFPRAPFEVWSRPRDYSPSVKLLSSPRNVTGTDGVGWASGSMIEVMVDAEPTAGGSLTVQALTFPDRPIPDQSVTITSRRRVLFRSSGIVAIRTTGAGKINSILGVDETALANAPGWQRIEVVGLPYGDPEATLPEYNTLKQGPEAPTMTGINAAARRLLLGALMSPPVPLAGSTTLPLWPPANPNTYVTHIRGGGAPFDIVRKCLQQTDDGDPARRQHDFRTTQAIAGIQQVGSSSPPGPNADVELPVVALILLAVAGSSDAALAFGFGTYDLPLKLTKVSFGQPPVAAAAVAPVPPIATPPSFELYDLDYMVTAKFRSPFTSTQELAALLQFAPPPQVPLALQAQNFAINQAAAVDGDALETVKLSWQFPPRPQGYAVAAAHGSAPPAYLNGKRPPIVGGFDPYLTQRPASAADAATVGDRAMFMDAAAPVPAMAPIMSRYFVAGRDWFARWSPWATVNRVSTLLPVQTPALLNAAYEMGTSAISPGSKIVAGKLVVDFAWDWSQRNPDRVEFSSRLIPANAVDHPDPNHTGNFRTSNTTTAGGVLTVKFSGSPLVPQVLAPHNAPPFNGTVVELTQPPPSGNNRRYRLRLDTTVDFASGLEIALSVTARGAEKIRPAPANLSAIVGPRVAHASNPLPPPPPTLPPGIGWTALPDAANKARAVLAWPAVLDAAGYFVWEATEAAMREAVSPALPSYLPTDPPANRANVLRGNWAGSPANDERSLRAFARLNDRAITESRIELVLPGSADAIYAYRVSSVSQTGIESARSSSVAFFAVPRINRPGQPRLLARPLADGSGVNLLILPTPGKPAARLLIHRVNRPSLAEEIGLMGPAKLDVLVSAGMTVTVPLPDGTTETALSVFDAVSPRWAPYVYRVVAAGTHDPPNGDYGVQSLPSAAVSCVLAPASPPNLDLPLVLQSNASMAIVSFRSNLPARACPLGEARIEIMDLIVPTTGRAKRNRLLGVASHTVTQGAAPTLATPPATSTLIRSTPPDGSYQITYTARVPKPTGGRLLIVVTDPRGTSREFELGVP